MKIREICLEGFRGIRKRLELDVPGGFLVVSGRNGSGKSTLCDGIEYALSGHLRKYESESGQRRTERREAIEDYIWWRGETSALEHRVEVVFEDTEGDVPIVRHRDDSLGHITMSPHIDKRFYDPARAPNDPIFHICRTLILRDEEITQLSLDLHPNRRFEILREAVATYNFGKLEEKIKKALSLLGDFIHDAEKDNATKQAAHSDAVNRTLEARARFSANDEASVFRERLYELLELEPVSLERALQIAERQLGTLRDQADQLDRLYRRVEDLKELESDTQREGLFDKVQVAKEELAKVSEALRVNQLKMDECNAALESERSDQPVLKALQELHDIGERLGRDDGHCRLCGSKVDEKGWVRHLATIHDQVKNAGQLLAELKKKRDDVDGERRNLLRKQAEYQESADSGVSRLSWIDGERSEIVEIAGELNLPTPKSFYDLSEEIDKRRVLQDEKSKELEKIIDSCRPLASLEDVGKLEALESGAEEALKTARRKLGRLQDAKGALQGASRTIRRTSGEIVKDQVRHIGPLLEELYSRLKPHSEWNELELAISGDVQLALGMKVGEDLNPAFMFSSGQRRAVGLAFLLSVNMSRSWSKLRTQVLDDPVQHIDDYRSLNLVETLSGLRHMGHQVICTVEDQSLADLLCRRLRSKDAADGKRIELEYVSGQGVQLVREESIGPLRRRALKQVG